MTSCAQFALLDSIQRTSAIHAEGWHDRFQPIWAATVTDCSWPGAAVPNVRRKQTMENIGQIGEGLLYGASPTGSRRPKAAAQSSRGERSFDGAMNPKRSWAVIGGDSTGAMSQAARPRVNLRFEDKLCCHRNVATFHKCKHSIRLPAWIDESKL